MASPDRPNRPDARQRRRTIRQVSGCVSRTRQRFVLHDIEHGSIEYRPQRCQTEAVLVRLHAANIAQFALHGERLPLARQPRRHAGSRVALRIVEKRKSVIRAWPRETASTQTDGAIGIARRGPRKPWTSCQLGASGSPHDSVITDPSGRTSAGTWPSGFSARQHGMPGSRPDWRHR